MCTSFPSEMMFTSNSSVQAGAGFIFYRTLLLIPDPCGEWELISVSRPQHSGRCQVWGSSLPFYGWDLTALRLRDWMLWLSPSPVSHTGHFWTSPQLTSHRTDKWIDCIKMAEEIQPQAWKWMTFPPHRPLAPTPRPTTTITQQIKLSGIIYAAYKQQIARAAMAVTGASSAAAVAGVQLRRCYQTSGQGSLAAAAGCFSCSILHGCVTEMNIPLPVLFFFNLKGWDHNSSRN